MGMVKVYAHLCEVGSYNFYKDVENSSKKSVRNLAADVRKQIEADGYIILDDGTCVKVSGKMEADEEPETI